MFDSLNKTKRTIVSEISIFHFKKDKYLFWTNINKTFIKGLRKILNKLYSHYKNKVKNIKRFVKKYKKKEIKITEKKGDFNIRKKNGKGI